MRIHRARAALRVLIVVAFVLATLVARVSGGGPAASAPPSPSPPVTPIAVPEVAERAEQAAILLQSLAQSPADANVEEIESQVAAADDWIQRRFVGTTQTLDSLPSENGLTNLIDLWQVMRSRLGASNMTLTSRATLLQQQVEQLETMRATWSATRQQALEANAPASVIERVDATLAAIGVTRASIDRRLGRVLALQDRVVKQIARCDDVVGRISAATHALTGPVLSRNAPLIWSREARAPVWAASKQRLLDSFGDMVDLTRDFLADELVRVPLQIALFVIVLLLARRARAAARRRADKQPSEHTAAQVFELPMSSAVVVALLATPWIYPHAPRLMMNVVGLLVLVPAVLIVRKLASPVVVPAVYALAAFFLVDRVREVCSVVPVLEQRVFLLEIVAGFAFLALAVRSERLLADREAPGLAGRRAMTRILWAQLSVFGVAVAAGVLGYMRLARLLGTELLASSYLALVLYAGVRVGEGLLAYGLRASLARRLYMVQNHGALLQHRGSVALRWLAVGAWVYFILDALGLMTPIWSASAVAFQMRYARGSVNLSLGDLIAFILTIAAAFGLASVMRVILDEDVYPRVWLPRGVPYAVSTLIRYAIILTGFIVAILALGVDLNRVTLVAGALGVGVGIGLQNVVANFVAGLILLLERRIHVGDSIQIGELQGQVRAIGGRASTIRTWDGAEVIVPNASLTSERVTNWTLSDRLRRVTLPVGVSYTADPEHVMAMLRDVARAHPKALVDPAPVVLCTGFGESALNFELRVWTARSEEAELVSSQLALAVHAALTAAKIEIPFPQRDIHIRTADGQAPS